MKRQMKEDYLDTAGIAVRINSLRIVLIVGIMIVHIPYDQSTSPYNDQGTCFDWLRILLGDVIFRAGVPCLSAFSGYLLFRHGAIGQYGALLKKKLRTLVIPYLFWNIGLFACVMFAQTIGVMNGYFPDLRAITMEKGANLLLSVSENPINLPLYFLRDLFVCFLLAPIVKTAVGKAPLLTLISLLIVPVVFNRIYILLRPDILFTFAYSDKAPWLTSADGSGDWARWIEGVSLACERDRPPP